MVMGAAASGAGKVNQNSSSQNTQNAFQKLESALIDSTKQFDTEAMGVADNSKAGKGGVEQQYGNNNVVKQDQPTAAGNIYIPQEQQTEELQKKKKLLEKKANFEDKLETLSQLEGLIDETQVEEEEKGIIKEFFNNMNRIRNLRSRLKQLESEEKMLEERQQQQQDQQKKKKDDQQPGDKKKPWNPF